MRVFLIILIVFVASSTFARTDQDIKDLSLYFDPDKIVVCASGHKQKLENAPASVVVVTKKEINDRGYRNLNDLMRDVPGYDLIHVWGTWPTLYFPRGLPSSTNNHVILMIDGIVDNNLGEGAILGGPQYSLQNVKRVELVYGPYSALYGANAFGGVINIVTESGRDLHYGDVRVGGGYYKEAFGELLLGHYFKKQDLDVSLWGGWYRTDGPDFASWHTEDYTYNGSRVPNAYHIYGKLRYKGFDFGLRFWDRPMGEGTFAVPTAMRPYGNMWHVRNFTVFTRQRIKLNRELKVKISLIARRSDILPDSTEFDEFLKKELWYKRRDKGYTLKLEGKWYKKDINRLFIGIAFENDELMSYAQKKDHFPPPDGRQFDWTDLSLWLQDEIHVARWMQIVVGFWESVHSDYGEHFNPRAALIFKPKASWTIKLLYGRAFRAPTVWEKYTDVPGVRVPNPDLGPEFVDSVEALVSYRYRHLFFIQSSIFYNRLSDMIMLKEVDPIDHITMHVNGGNAWVIGWQNSLQINILPWLSMFGNYTFQHTRDVQTDGPLPYLAANKGTVGVNFSYVPHLNVNIRANFVGKRSTAITSPVHYIGRYTLLNASIQGRNLGVKGLDVALNLYNLLNISYYDPGIRSGSGAYYPVRHPQPDFAMDAYLKYRF